MKKSKNFDFLINLFLVTTLIAIFLLVSCYRIGNDFPPGLNHDAAWGGLYALRVLKGEPFRFFVPEGWGKLTSSTLILTTLFKLFGVSKEMIELHCTLYGLLGIISFYFLTSCLTKNKILSFFLSLLLIFNSAFILYSRAGWSSIGVVPFINLILALSILYLEKPKLKYAVFLGIFSGLNLYIYDGARLSIMSFLIYWGVLILNKFKTKQRGQAINNFFWSLFFLIVILFPLGLSVSRNWQAFNARAQALSSNINLTRLLENFKTGFLFYNVSAHGDDFFTNFSVLEGPVSYLWVIGFLAALIDFGKYWLIILLFFTYFFPSVLTTPSFHRAIGTLSIVVIFACLPLIELFNLVKKKSNKIFINLYSLLLIIIILLQAYYSIEKLYIKKTPFLWGFYPETTVIGKYIQKIKSDNEIIVYAGNWPIDSLTFLALRPFKNYQSYSTPSHDGIIEILQDLKTGGIDQNKTVFIVEKTKVTAFRENLSANKFTIQNIDVVKNKKGEVIAEVFKSLSFK